MNDSYMLSPTRDICSTPSQVQRTSWLKEELQNRKMCWEMLSSDVAWLIHSWQQWLPSKIGPSTLHHGWGWALEAPPLPEELSELIVAMGWRDISSSNGVATEKWLQVNNPHSCSCKQPLLNEMGTHKKRCVSRKGLMARARGKDKRG